MKLITTLSLLIIHALCMGQSPIQALLDSVLTRAKAVSMYTGQVNWDSLEAVVHQQARQATSLQELEPAFTCLLNGMLDKHGKIIDANTYRPLAQFTAFESLTNTDTRTRDSETWKVVNDTALHFQYKLIEGEIGYLKIVGIAPNVDIELESKRIRKAVIDLAESGVEKWIIDLRYNGGGNMYPMLAGIAPLIGDGIVGGLIDLAGEKQFDWEIRSSNFIYGGQQAVDLPDEPMFEEPPKVAVLTSRWTVSSGEVVATCFKGRPQTRFFGEASGGYTTNNGWEIINGEVVLAISTGIYCDRNGAPYPHNLPVDVEIPFEVVADLDKDYCIGAAVDWLRK